MAYQSKYTGLQIDDILDSVEWKQDKIADLASIRSGAEKGATALQSYTEKYTGTITGIKMNGASKGTSGVVDLGTVITAHQDISGKQDKLTSGTNIKTINGESILGEGDLKIDGSIETYDVPFSTGELIAVKEVRESAIKANFDELTQAIKDKKLIIFTNDGGVTVASAKYNSRRKCTYLTVIDHRGVAIYVKWNDGDTELPAENIELFDIGGIDYRLGLLEEDIPSAVTESTVSGWGFTKNTGTYSKPSTGIPKSDLASDVQTSLGKADTALQSYTEQYKGTVTGVKINGTTKSPTSGVVDLGYVNKQLSTSTSSSMSLSPNIYYRNTSTSLSTLTITLGSASNSNIINEYFVEFTTRSSGTTVSLPSTIKWANGEAPTFEASTTYQISIVNNLGVVTKFK